MEKILLNERQKNNLCKTIAKLVFDLKANKNVECIYLAPYKDFFEGLEEGVLDNTIEITIVLKEKRGNQNKLSLSKLLSELNSQYEKSISDYGVNIFVDADSSKTYTSNALNPSEILKSNYLFNSVILFDRTGKYIKLKQRVDSYGEYQKRGIFYYENLAEIIPPINDEIIKQLETLQLEQDTKAVKEFTKSKLFKQFKKLEQ